jgi:hypothetical protein
MVWIVLTRLHRSGYLSIQHVGIGKVSPLSCIDQESIVLAVQNMKAVGAIGKDHEQDVEFAALEGSLSMMSKGESLIYVILISADL